MDPEKINNVESKENEVSDKEAKTLQKVDPTDIDENYEKNVKIPKTNEKDETEYSVEQYESHKDMLTGYIKDSCSIVGGKIVNDESISYGYGESRYTNPNIIRKWGDRSTQDLQLQVGEKNRREIYEKIGDISKVSPDIVIAWIIKFNQTLSNYKYIIDSGLGDKVAKDKEWEDKIKNTPQINIDGFMKEFMKDQKNKLSIVREEKVNEPLNIDPWSKDQKIGEFVMTEDSKNNILSNFQKASNILDMQITGRADATGPRDKDIPGNQVNNSKALLLSKGINETMINNVELSDGRVVSVDTFVNDKDDKNKLNQTRAYARALMQVDFLPKEQLQKLINCPSFKIKIEAQDVINGKKGDEYTGGGIQMITDGNVKVKETVIGEKQPTNEVPKPFIDLGTISFGTMLGLNKNIKIVLSEKGELKLTQVNDGSIQSTAGGFANDAIHSTAYGTIRYNANEVNEVNFDKGVGTFVNDRNLLSDLGGKFWVSVNLERDLGLNVSKDVPGQGGTHTPGVVLNEVDAKDFDKKFNEYMTKIEKTPDKFIQILESYSSDKNTTDIQKDYIKNVIKNINDAKSIAIKS